MNKLCIGLLFLLISAMACKNNHADCAEEHASVPTDSVDAHATHFGAEFSPAGAVSYDELLKQMPGKDTLVIKVMGTVNEVCQMKGCWMNIAASDTNQLPLHITFKDYAYAVPKDIAGKKVALEGFAYYEETPVDELKHIAEDAGSPQAEIDAITEPRVELKYEASGVAILQ